MRATSLKSGGSSLDSAVFETPAQLLHVELHCSNNNLKVEATYVSETQSTRGQIEEHLNLYLRRGKTELQIIM
jgi:hypothetical protein